MIAWAENELGKLLEYTSSDEERELQAKINENILSLVKEFANQEHSGFTAQYVLNVFSRIISKKPLTPLTEEADEWAVIDYDEENKIVTYSNKRLPSLYKYLYTSTGEVDYKYTEGYVFSHDGGHSWYTVNELPKFLNSEIKFPFFPPTEPQRVYVEIDDEGNIISEIKDPEVIQDIYNEWNKYYQELAEAGEETDLPANLEVAEAGEVEQEIVEASIPE